MWWAVPTQTLFSPQGCRSPRCSRTPRTRSSRGSIAAAAKRAPCSPTRSCLAWRRDSRSSATCPRLNGWSWPRPSACPRHRWARPQGGPDLCSTPLGSTPTPICARAEILNDPAPLDFSRLQKSVSKPSHSQPHVRLSKAKTLQQPPDGEETLRDAAHGCRWEGPLSAASPPLFRRAEPVSDSENRWVLVPREAHARRSLSSHFNVSQLQVFTSIPSPPPKHVIM